MVPAGAPAGNSGRSPVPRGARDSARPSRSERWHPVYMSGCALRALSPPHPSDLMQANLFHLPLPRVAKARFEVRCLEEKVQTGPQPARSGEQRAGFKLEKHRLSQNHGPRSARCSNLVGFGAFKGKDFSSAGPVPPPWSLGEGGGSQVRTKAKWHPKITLGLTSSFVDLGWWSEQLIGNLRIASVFPAHTKERYHRIGNTEHLSYIHLFSLSCSKPRNNYITVSIERRSRPF